MMGFNCFLVAKPVEHYLLNVLFCHFQLIIFTVFYSCCVFLECGIWFVGIISVVYMPFQSSCLFMSFRWVKKVTENVFFNDCGKRNNLEKVTISKRLQCEDVRSNIAVTRRDRLNQILNEQNSN